MVSIFNFVYDKINSFILTLIFFKKILKIPVMRLRIYFTFIVVKTHYYEKSHDAKEQVYAKERKNTKFK